MTLRALLAHGARAARRCARLVAGLYLVEAGVALLFALAAWRTLASLYARHPLFDRGVGGDLGALILALRAHPGALVALAWCGLAVALGYAVLSLYLTAGLLGALDGGRFADHAGARFPAFLRVWLWSLLPYGAALVLLGLGLVVAGVRAPHPLSVGALLVPLLLGAAPGLLALLGTSLAVDYARVLLVRRAGASSGTALLQGARLLFNRPIAPLHFLGYLATTLALTAAYLAFACTHPLPGAAGALALLVLRQALLAARFAARAVLLGGQLAVVPATAPAARSA